MIKKTYTGSTKILFNIWTRGDKRVNKYQSTLPTHIEPYLHRVMEHPRDSVTSRAKDIDKDKTNHRHSTNIALLSWAQCKLKDYLYEKHIEQRFPYVIYTLTGRLR